MFKNLIIKRITVFYNTFSKTGIKQNDVWLVVFDFGTDQSAQDKFVSFELFFLVFDENIAQLRLIHSHLIVMRKGYKASCFLESFDVTKAHHINFKSGTANCQQSVSQIALSLGLSISCNAFLHTFRNSRLNDGHSQTNFLIWDQSSDCVLTNFILT